MQMSEEQHLDPEYGPLWFDAYQKLAHLIHRP